jgi:hypothetical protein
LTSDGTSNAAVAESNLTFNGNTLTLGSATGATGIAVNILGSTGQLLQVSDTITGSILEVGDLSGSPIFSVNSDGFTKTSSGYFTGQTSTFVVFSTPDTSGVGAEFNYYVINTATNGYRYGQVMVVWNATANTTEFTESSTEDLGSSTEGLAFTASITSDNLKLTANITSGTWTIKIGASIL